MRLLSFHISINESLVTYLEEISQEQNALKRSEIFKFCIINYCLIFCGWAFELAKIPYTFVLKALSSGNSVDVDLKMENMKNCIQLDPVAGCTEHSCSLISLAEQKAIILSAVIQFFMRNDV